MEQINWEEEQLQKESGELLAEIPDGLDQFKFDIYYREWADITFREKGYTQSALDSMLEELPLWFDKLELLRYTQLEKKYYAPKELPQGAAPIDTHRTFLNIPDKDIPSHPRQMGRLLARAKKLIASLWDQYCKLREENTLLRQRIRELEAQPATATATHSTPAAPKPPARKATVAIDPADLLRLRREAHQSVAEILALMCPLFPIEVLPDIEQGMTDIGDTAPLCAYIDNTLVQSGLMPLDFARSKDMCRLYAAFSACRNRDGSLLRPKSLQTALQRYYRRRPR